MHPVLFNANATAWTTFGIGVLSSAISCEVEENRNGTYELEMTYPVTGAHYADIALRCLIVAKPNYTDNPQPFRIYNISKPLNGVVTINAQHISYDLSGYIDGPFSATGIQEAISRMTSSTVIYPTSCPFTFSTDLSGTQTMNVKHPTSVRALMGGIEGSLIDNYGGEWHFDGYNCALNSARGANRGVIIRYGKNLTDLRQEENNAAVYTAVYPYYYNGDTETLVTLPEKVVQVAGTFNYTRVMQLDLTSEFNDAPTTLDLKARAKQYITTNSVGVPKVNLTVSFEQLDTLRDRVDLCDTVSVRFDALGVSATAKCIRTKWDVLKGRYIEAEFGSAKNSLASTIAKSQEIAQVVNRRMGSQIAEIAKNVADKVVGHTGGYIMLHDTDNDDEPDEILIMNAADISTATKIIRINNAGIAFSKTGYNGTYSTAWNIDGEFVADFIASGQLKTNNVTILGDTQFYWDNSNITLINPTNTNKIVRLGKYDGTNYGLGFSTDGGRTWKAGFNFDGIIADMITSGAINASLITTGTLDAGLIKAGTISTNLVTIAGSNQFKWSNEYIQIINPSNTNQIIRFGKYNGSNYGLGFSTDGGSTWRAGFTFTGIYVLGGGTDEATARISGGAFVLLDKTGLSLANIGHAQAHDGSGTDGNFPIYRLGTYKTTSRSGNTYTHYQAHGMYCFSAGRMNLPVGIYSVCAGCDNETLESYAIAMGYGNTSSGLYGLSIGYQNTASAQAAVALGYQSAASGQYSFAEGYTSTASGKYAIAMGYDCDASKEGSTALGKSSEASGLSGTAVGSGSKASGDYSFAEGNTSESSGKYAIAMGYACKATKEGSTAIGKSSVASGTSATAIGNGSTASGDYSFVEGDQSESSGKYGIAMGYISKANAEGAIAIGYKCEAAQWFATAIGYNNHARGLGSTAIGFGNVSNGETSTALGYSNEVSDDYGVAIGYFAKSTIGDSVAIGTRVEAARSGQFVCGRYNITSSTHIFILGNGTAATSKSNAMTVDQWGNMWIAGTLTQSSDRRLKNVSGELPDVSGIRAVRFRWNEKQHNGDNKEHIGYIAQDVEEAAPYLVQEDETTGYKSLDYIALLCAKVDQLERTVEALTNRIMELEAKC